MSENNTKQQNTGEPKNNPENSGRIKGGILFWIATAIGLLIIYVIASVLYKWLSLGH
jgi:hypothetical protein